jgi:conjugal transfer mating pair stabilization protein TraG
MEFWAFMNVEEVRAVFSAIVAICGDGDMLGAMKSLALIGLLVAVGAAMLLLQRVEGIWTWFLMLTFFYVGLFLPKKDLLIQDRTGVQAATVVANVPLGLAFFASTTSKIGAWLTGATETVFVLPADLKFQKNGMMFGAKLVQDARTLAVSDPKFRYDLMLYIRNCLNPDILDGYKDPKVIRDAPDLWAAIGDTNPGRWTTVDSGANTQNCPNAYAYLSPLWAAQVSEATTLFGRLTNTVEPNPAAAETLVKSQLADAYSTLLGISATATSIVQQNMMLNLFNDAAITIPQLMNDPVAAQSAIAKAQADASAAVQYSVMGKIGEEALPKVRNVMELLIIGLFPMLFLFMIGAGVKGLSLLKNYVMALMWVQLWAPLYAILNFIGTYSTAAKMKAALTGTTGITMGNVDIVQSVALSQQNIAGMLTLSVPVIAWAIVKMGELGMGSAASAAFAPSTSGVGGAAGSISSGNLNAGNTSLDNKSYNNTQANKDNREMQIMSNAASIGMGAYKSSVWGSASGGGMTVDIAKNDTGAMVAAIGQQQSRALSQSAASSSSEATRLETSGATTTANALTHAVATQKSRVTSAELGSATTSQETATMQRQLAATEATKQAIMKGTGLDEKQAAAITVELGADGKLGAIAKGSSKTEAVSNGSISQSQSSGSAGSVSKKQTATASEGKGRTESGDIGAAIKGNAKLQQKYGAETAAKIAQSLEGTSAEQWSNVSGHLSSLANSQSYRTAVASSSTNSSGVTASLSEGKTQTTQAGVRREEAKSYQQQATEMANGTASSGLNVLSLPANASLLPGMMSSINSAMAKGDAKGALAAYDAYMQHIGLRPPAPTAPSQPQSLPDGSAAPNKQSLDGDYAADAAKIKAEHNPKAGYTANKGKASGNISPVEPPSSLQGAGAKLENVRATQDAGFAGAKAANQGSRNDATERIGVSHTPNGTMVSNRQLGNQAAGMAATDIAIGAVNATTPAAKVLDTVGNAVGAGNLGSKAQDAALKAAGVDPKQVRRPDGYNPKDTDKKK